MSDNRLTWEQAVQWLRNQPDKQELVRACYYDDPLEDAAERFYKSEEWSEVRRLLANYIPCKVLDLGAGRGISSYAFAKEGCEVVAIEPNPSDVVGGGAITELSKKKKLNIITVHKVGEALPFPDNSFDIVYGRAVLHHLEDLKKTCSEIGRVLKRGGVFLFTREHVISKKRDAGVFLKAHPLHFLYGGENAYPLKEYLLALKNIRSEKVKVLGSYQSVINYSPMLKEQYVELEVANRLKKFFGGRGAAKLAREGWMQGLVGWYLSKRDHAPGRLFTFRGVKK